jgi:ornithine carbamoyltransferase
MGLSRSSADLQPPATPLPGEDPAVLERARTLQHAAQCGRIQPLLRGKHLGLLCDNDTRPAAQLFRQAAAELGAQVAHIGMSLSERSPAQEVAHTARMLGRLYDAIECQGMAGALVGQIAELSGIPVYDGLAADDARLARLALLLGPDAAAAQNRRFVLQALLLHSIT